MSIQFWLVPLTKRKRTHIMEYGHLFYYCGSVCRPYRGHTNQGPLKPEGAKLCGNCVRVFKARRGVEP